MTRLATFARYARKMATAQHRPDCQLPTFDGYIHPDPDCTGCITEAERAEWARIADEHDAHLAQASAPADQGALFEL